MIYVVFGAVIVGITLGLTGSGGSILTVPVLTYLIGHDSKVAVAESLAIVGLIALVTVFPYARSKEVDWRSVVYFGVPGMVGTYAGAWLASFLSGSMQLTIFALVMLAAAFMMFRKRPSQETDTSHKRHAIWQIAAEGTTVGIITGLVGVGGGFLIVPALVLLGGLSMRVAVGTSLAVISLNSASGFYKYLDVLSSSGTSIDWGIVTAFVVIGIVGSFLGKHISTHVDQQTLRRAFAVFLMVMGIAVFAKEAPGVIARQHASAGAAHSLSGDLMTDTVIDRSGALVQQQR